MSINRGMDLKKKMRSIHTMECYSATKKSEMMPFAATWMGLEIILLSEVRQISYDVTSMYWTGQKVCLGFYIKP